MILLSCDLQSLAICDSKSLRFGSLSSRTGSHIVEEWAIDLMHLQRWEGAAICVAASTL